MSPQDHGNGFDRELRTYLEERAEAAATQAIDAGEMFDRVRARAGSSISILKVMVVVAALVALGLIALVAAGTLPVPRPPIANGPIAYVAGGRILVLAPGGSARDIGAAPRGGSCCEVAWSPDGRRLVVASDTSVVLVSADGSVRDDLVADELVDGAPTWSPVANTVALSLAVDGVSQIIAVDITSHRRIQVTHAKGYARMPAFSPDGTEIAFGSPDEQGNSSLFVAAADGSRQRLIVPNSHGSDNLSLSALHAWSPDGSRIAYTVEPTNRAIPPQLHVVRLDTGVTRPLMQNPRTGSVPAWSADGRSVAFISLRDDRTGYDLWVVEADGIAPRVLARDVNRFAWSPDGTRIAYANVLVNGTAAVHTIALDGTDRQDLPITSFDGTFAWGPAAT